MNAHLGQYRDVTKSSNHSLHAIHQCAIRPKIQLLHHFLNTDELLDVYSIAENGVEHGSVKDKEKQPTFGWRIGKILGSRVQINQMHRAANGGAMLGQCSAKRRL